MALFFTLKKKLCILVLTHFYLGGVFGVFYAKIVVFMDRFIVLSIKFSFHSISGFDIPAVISPDFLGQPLEISSLLGGTRAQLSKTLFHIVCLQTFFSIY